MGLGLGLRYRARVRLRVNLRLGLGLGTLRRGMASFFFLDFFERLPVGLIGHLFGHQRLQHLRFRLRLSAWLASAWLG